MAIGKRYTGEGFLEVVGVLPGLLAKTLNGDFAYGYSAAPVSFSAQIAISSGDVTQQQIEEAKDEIYAQIKDFLKKNPALNIAHKALTTSTEKVVGEKKPTVYGATNA